MKDSSNVNIDHCTYYGNFYALANYQKHPGDAGSNLTVTNSVLSNSYELGYFNDEYSAISISNSLDDTEKLPSGNNNIHKNPFFRNPTEYDFTLLPESPLIGAGTNGTTIGANLLLPALPVSVMISDIAYVNEPGTENLEFIGLYNPGNSPISLDSCSFTEGITYIFQAGTAIEPKGKIYITSNSASLFWKGKGVVVYQWESGHLADEGEKIQLSNKYGKVIDQVVYNNKSPWPLPSKSSEGITLTRFDVDNHFGENWKLIPVAEMVSVPTLSKNNLFSVYPNPTTNTFTIKGLEKNQSYEVINIQGKVITKGTVDSETISIDLSEQKNGIYLIRSGNVFRKILLMK